MTANTPPAAVSSPRNDQLRLDLAASRRDGLAVMIARDAIAGQPLTMVEAFQKADADFNQLTDDLAASKRRLA